MIFVTGGTGLVGSHLLFELAKAGKKVKALKRETSNVKQVLKTFSYYTETPEELFNRIEWVNGDILDYFSLEEALKDVTEIYHCAAIISFNPRERKKMIANNVQGTVNLVNAALETGVKKFCHVSSVAALGGTGNGAVVDEQVSWVPSKKASGYSESKFFSETEIWRGIEEGLEAVIVNPSIILGPGNWNTGSAKLFQAVDNGMKFYTKGVTGFVDVKDVVKAMILLMDDTSFEKVKNQRYLLNSENLEYRELFSKIAAALNRPAPRIYASPLMLEAGWRMAKILSFFTRKPETLTRETARTSQKINRFDGSKICRTLPFVYLPIDESIRQTTRLFMMDTEKPDYFQA